MAQQTAVEWLVEQLIPKAMVTYDATTYNAVQQAKAMEKEQIIKAWDERGNRIVPRYFLEENINGEQYYNETYGK